MEVDSDVEILEERNGSPGAGATAAGKRKLPGKSVPLVVQRRVEE